MSFDNSVQVVALVSKGWRVVLKSWVNFSKVYLELVMEVSAILSYQVSA